MYSALTHTLANIVLLLSNANSEIGHPGFLCSTSTRKQVYAPKTRAYVALFCPELCQPVT